MPKKNHDINSLTLKKLIAFIDLYPSKFSYRGYYFRKISSIESIN